MNAKTRGILLYMVLAFVVCILLIQLWLFTEALDAARSPASKTMLAAAVVSGLACMTVWKLINYFLTADQQGRE